MGSQPSHATVLLSWHLLTASNMAQVAGRTSWHCDAGARAPKDHSDLHAVLLLSPLCPPAAALAGAYLLAGAMQWRDSTPAYPHTCIGDAPLLTPEPTIPLPPAHPRPRTHFQDPWAHY